MSESRDKGTGSPCRDRSVEESEKLFNMMKMGMFNEG